MTPEIMKIGFGVFGKVEGGSLYRVHQEYMADFSEVLYLLKIK